MRGSTCYLLLVASLLPAVIFTTGCNPNEIGLASISGVLWKVDWKTSESVPFVGHDVELYYGGELKQASTSSSVGDFVFENIAFAEWEVRPAAAPPGYVWDPESEVVLTRPGDQHVVVLFFLRVSSSQGVEGTLTSADGSPVVGHIVDLFAAEGGGGSGPGPPLKTTLSNGDGHYEFLAIPPGDYVVMPAPPQDGFGWDPEQVEVTVELEQLVGDQDFTLGAVAPPGYGPDDVSGTLTGLDGGPVAGHQVRLIDADGVAVTSVSDANGFYFFTDVEPAPYRLRPDPGGSGAEEWEPEFRDTVKVDGVNLLDQDFFLVAVPRTDEITGMLWDSDGAPVADHQVELRELDSLSLLDTVATDADGLYVFSDVAAGAYRVQPTPAGGDVVWEPEFRDVTKVDDANLTDQNFALQPAPGYGPNDISGTLTRLDGTPVEGHTVVLFQGEVVGTVVSDPDGFYGFPNVTPGEYRILPASAAPGAVWEPFFRDVVKVADVNLPDQDFVLNPPAPPPGYGPDEICGTLTDEEGGPVGEYSIVLLREGGASVLDAVVSDADGFYFFETVEPGSYRVQPSSAAPDGAWEPPFRDVVKEADVNLPDQDFLLVAVTPPPDGELHGHMIDDSGAPVADVTVELWLYASPYAQTTTDADGHYSFASLPAGATCYVWALSPPAGYYFDPWYHIVTMPADGSGLGGVDFVLRTGGNYTVTVPVMEYDSVTPFAGATVRLDHTAGGYGPWTATTGPDGVAVFSNVPSGKLLARVTDPGSAQGYYWAPDPLEVYLEDSDLTTRRICRSAPE